MRRGWTRWWSAALLGACAVAATVDDTPTEGVEVTAVPLRFGSLSVYTENDKYFAGTDRNYTNGFKVSVLSANLRGFDEEGVPEALRLLSRGLRPLMRDDAIPKLGLSFGQNIYTPENTKTTAPLPDDRPYAAWLYLGVNYQNYHPQRADRAWDRLVNVEVQIGAAGGDWALGEFVQNSFHDLAGIARVNGWRNQIASEPGINLIYEHKWRRATPGAWEGWGMDVIPHAGFCLGNVFTYANAGLSLRVGYRLPADFGTNLIRPSGDSNPVRRPSFGLWLFGAVDGRAVARDVTLDGNTWRSGGPSISKRPFVADLVGGVGVGTVRWQLTYAQALRTKEFRGQEDSQVFGSISLSYFY